MRCWMSGHRSWHRILWSVFLLATFTMRHFQGEHSTSGPYSGSTLKDHQMGFRKLFLAPPLSVKNQDGSPIQARGFSVVWPSTPDHLGNRLYWYDGLSASFNPDSSAEPDSSARFHRAVPQDIGLPDRSPGFGASPSGSIGHRDLLHCTADCFSDCCRIYGKFRYAI